MHSVRPIRSLKFLHRDDYVSNKVKGRISRRRQQENNARQIFRKTNICHPLIRPRTRAYQEGGKKCSFFRKFCLLCLLVTSVLRFAFWPYYRWILIILLLTHFRPISSFYTPRKHQKTRGFLMFSGDIERKHWPERFKRNNPHGRT